MKLNKIFTITMLGFLFHAPFSFALTQEEINARLSTQKQATQNSLTISEDTQKRLNEMQNKVDGDNVATTQPTPEYQNRLDEKYNQQDTENDEMSDDDKWGCELLLCLAGNSGHVHECKEPIRKAMRAWAKGHTVPMCPMGGGSGYTQSSEPTPCPDTHPTTISMSYGGGGGSSGNTTPGRQCRNEANTKCETKTIYNQGSPSVKEVCTYDDTITSGMVGFVLVNYEVDGQPQSVKVYKDENY